MHALFTHISHKIMMYKYFLYWYTFLYFKLILLFTWINFFNELEIFTCILSSFFFSTLIHIYLILKSKYFITDIDLDM